MTSRQQRIRRARAFLARLPHLGRERTRVVTWFYNLDNHRPDRQVRRELEAIAATDPDEIALCETIGNELPRLPGYHLLRDRSTDGRENIAVYVADRWAQPRERWIDCKQTWTRTERPGRHPARSHLVYRLGLVQRVVGHQPPPRVDNANAARWEGIERVAKVMAPWKRRPNHKRPPWPIRQLERARPRLLTWDGNARVGDPHGPDVLARRIGGKVTLPKRIDHAVHRGITVHQADVVDRVGGLPLESDHGHAIRLEWSAPSVWLPQRS